VEIVVEQEARMRMKIAVLAAVAGLTAGCTSAGAYDYNSRASYQAEMRRQHDRIMAGRRSGALSPTEYRGVRDNLKRIGQMGYNSTSRVMLSQHSKTVAYYKTN
jgi:hypothetical protein